MSGYEIYVDSIEYSTDVLLDSASMSWSRGHDQIRLLAPPRAGRLSLTLDNFDGAYDPGVSPVTRGKPVEVKYDRLGTPYPLWKGYVEEPTIRTADDTLAVSAFGSLARLAGKISTNLRSGETTGTLINNVLNEVGWPSGASYRDIDTGQTVVDWWWLDEADPFAALRDLLITEGPGAQLYEDAQGRIVFRDRHATLTEARSTAIQSTYGPSDLPAVEPVSYDDGNGGVINHAAMVVRTRTLTAEFVIWEHDEEQLILGPDEVRILYVTNDDPIRSTVVPVLGEDYQLVSGSIILLGFPVATAFRAKRIPLRIDAGSLGAKLNGLRVRGKTIPVTSEVAVENTVDASASQTTHGLRSYPYAPLPEIDPLVAQDLCNAVVLYYKDGRPTVQVSTFNRDDTATLDILQRDIGDRVRVILPQIAFDDEMLILQRDDVVSGHLHSTRLGCEVATLMSGVDPFVLGTSQLDGADVLWA